MRRPPGWLGRLGPWLLPLAVLLCVLFALSFLVQAPRTLPSRMRHAENASLPLPSPEPRATVTGRGDTTAPWTPLLENSTDSRPQASARTTAGSAGAAAREQSGPPRTAQPASPRSQGRMAAAVSTPSPRSPDRGTAWHSTRQDARATSGRGDRPGQPPATSTVPARPPRRASTPAWTRPPQSQDKAPTTPRARPTPRRGPAEPSPAAAAPKESARAPLRSRPPQRPGTRTAPRPPVTTLKSQPKWDFEDEYSVDSGSLRTTCPDSLKVKAARSPWLQSLFLPNITLFLDSARFNRSEWGRLEHFTPPFGFMDLNYSVVRSVVAHFPPVPQQQLLLAGRPAGSCVSCAVVGNGGILNNSRQGQEIDSHDYVFRLSGAVIKGYEQDVGTRTSFYGFTAFSLTQSLLILGQRGFRHVPLGEDVRYLHFLEGARDFDWLEALLLNKPLRKQSLFWFGRNPRDVFPKDLSLERYLLLHPDLMRYIKNRFLRSNTLNTVHWRIYRPTTGALLLLTALQLCDRVSAYGFITEGHERFSDHYYDRTWRKTVFYINHDFKLERAVWKRLHDEGILRLYQRPAAARPQS